MDPFGMGANPSVNQLPNFPRKLGSMVGKWVISPTYKWDILGLYPTDPNHLLTSSGTLK